MPGRTTRGHYVRLIRYVTTSAGVDLGMLQLAAGKAAARYDGLACE
jgi:micrococcal nuclease